MKRISLNKVMAKLAEVQSPEQVDLNNEQVELASVKALKTYITRLEKGDSDLQKSRDKILAEADKIGKMGLEFSRKLSSYEGNIENAEEELKNVVKALKDLGVDSGSPDVQKAEAAIKDAKSGVSYFGKIDRGVKAARKNLSI